jgi:hypothetical protein
MVVLLHGATGGWDELAIAVVALAVLWIAVKLAGRKPASDEDDETVQQDTATGSGEERTDPAHPSTPKLG